LCTREIFAPGRLDQPVLPAPRRHPNFYLPSGPVGAVRAGKLQLEARDQGGSYQMWDTIKAAIQSNGTTARFIVIIAVLVMAAWLIQALH